MLVITISILSLVGFCILGYLIFSYRNKAIDCSIKYNAIKDFAQTAAQRILELEAAKSEMAQQIHKLSLLIPDTAPNQETNPSDPTTNNTPRNRKPNR